MAETKLVFDCVAEPSAECGTVCRIAPSAAVMVTDIMRRTNLPASKIITRMIKFAYENCEVKK